ncbi:MAG: aspartate--tRNA(Asn) ligase [Candidatus Pacebacteria bacterium]|nr:aspartate--tRNA(Asn) ligase [Candidatus Paceibacterota bacterium]
MKERTLIKEAPQKIGKQIKVEGWINTIRSHGSIVFFDLRDRSGILQVICEKKVPEGLKEEDVVCIEGLVKKRPQKMENKDIETGKVELEAQKIERISQAVDLPFALKDTAGLSLPVLLDFRPLTLRSEQVKAILKVEEEVIDEFRQTLKSLDFTEFQAPAIVPTATEGGAEIFKINYYETSAFLGQSPQFYKQILVGAFERVFTVAKAYRAEPSVTTRHLSEYISLDAEMGFIEQWTDLMDTCEIIIKNIFKRIEAECSKELKLLKATVPQISKNIPRIKMREAQQTILERTKRDNTKEPDLTPEDEKEICQWAKEKHGSEVIFITHYPTKKRPFYTMPDKEDPDFTLSFDVLCRGLEITTGGQRINDYKMLVENIKKWGNKPEQFEFYLQAFKYGMPQEGGFAFGAERIVKQVLGLENLREASAFPRDMARIDGRLSNNE